MANHEEKNKTKVPCDAGWNDPPMLSNPSNGADLTSGPRRTVLNKRVAFPFFGGQLSATGNSSPPKGAVATPPTQQFPAHLPVSDRARTPTAEAAALPRGARSSNPPGPDQIRERPI